MSYTLIRRPKTACLPKGAQIEATPTGRVARWTDASGKACCAPMEGNHRIVTSPGEWAMKYDDATGCRTSLALHTTDRRLADQKAIMISALAQGIRSGLIDPRSERLRTEGAKGINVHLEDFRESMTNKGNNEDHVRDTCNMITRLVKAIGATRLMDLTDDRVIAAIVKMGDDRAKKRKIKAVTKGKAISARRRNSYIVAVKSFSAWCAKNDRLQLDPLRNLSKQWKEETDRRLVRRELLTDEFRRLMDAARAGATHHRLTGDDRALLYALAFTTGLRRKELGSLTAGAFDLDAKYPVVRAAAGYTKNQDEAVQPLGPNMVALLRPVLAFKIKTTPLFPNLTKDTADAIRLDLKAARDAWIAEAGNDAERARRVADPDFLVAEDSEGRKVDFHGGRHHFISAVVASGASVKVAQELARHSTPILTIGRYAHTRLKDRVAHVPALPVMAAV